MACLAAALAFGAVAVDEHATNEWLVGLGWSYGGGAEGASLLLSTVAASMIAIAGTVFSMTLVVLSLASSQLGPRLLRNFMRDTINQVVLGTFVATFVYCVLVLRTIRRADESAFVPHLSVGVGLLLAMVSLGVLIYFIHHVSVSIQADEVVARVGRELEDGMDQLFPSHLGRPAAEPAAAARGASSLPVAFEHQARPVGAALDGYLQLVDADALMELACEEDLLIRLERRPGHYLVKGRAMAMVWPGDKVTEALAERLNAAFVLGNQRTATQDLEFSFLQLVEIAVRALSPGINDPFTAIACVDRLGSALCHLAQRDMPSPYRVDAQGRLRLVAPGPTFAGVVDASFNQIRQNSRSNPAVGIRMLEAIQQVAAHVRQREDIACLQRHADMIVSGSREGVPEANDLRDVETVYSETTRACRQMADGLPA